MGARKQDAGHITAPRASRLYRLLVILGDGPTTQAALVRRLKLDDRGFYRDLRLLRSLGIGVTAADARYRLDDSLDEALARLPVPDPQLSVREAQLLAKGTTPAHRKLRRQLDALTGRPSARNGDG
jgi:predicted DNA-binding transcriptional regulator YafY